MAKTANTKPLPTFVVVPKLSDVSVVAALLPDPVLADVGLIPVVAAPAVSKTCGCVVVGLGAVQSTDWVAAVASPVIAPGPWYAVAVKYRLTAVCPGAWSELTVFPVVGYAMAS